MKRPLLLLLPVAMLGGCGTFLLPHPAKEAARDGISMRDQFRMDTFDMGNVPQRDAAGRYTGLVTSNGHVPPDYRDPPMPPPPKPAR
jgi:hypothetical protein